MIQRKFYQFCSSWDLQEIVHKPTRKQNHLDIILTTHPERYGKVYVKPPLLNSDHDTVICHIKQPAQRNRVTRHERNFVTADCNTIAQHLSKCQWHNIFADCRSVNDYWLALYKVLCELIEMFAPTQTKRQGGCASANVSRHTSLPRVIRKLLLLKRRAWRRWRLNRTAPNKADFNMASRQCSTEIRRYLENQELRVLGIGSRKFFAYAARWLRPQDNIISLCSASGATSKPAYICSIFSDEFLSNFYDSSADIPTSSLPSDFSQPALGAPRLSNINIHIITVRQVLANLRESAARPGIPDIFYKRLAFWLASPLTTVYQQSIYQIRIPDYWGQAKVISHFKCKGDKSNPSNYRTISLTMIACKILDSIIVAQLRDYLENNTLMCPQQHGFMS